MRHTNLTTIMLKSSIMVTKHIQKFKWRNEFSVCKKKTQTNSISNNTLKSHYILELFTHIQYTIVYIHIAKNKKKK